MTNRRLTGREPLELGYLVETREQSEEVLVPDARNGVTPRQMVEAKLEMLLSGTSLGWIGRFFRSPVVTRR